MKIDILTLFPEMFKGPFDESMIKKARDEGLVEVNIHNLRDWAKDKHKSVDDRPYGGGPGMILRVDVMERALKNLKSSVSNHQSSIILLTPQGNVFSQKKAQELSKLNHLILVAGHYEGFDERIREHLVDEEISIGDYVLTGGELPTMVVVDAVVRLIPGVLEKEAKDNESFSKWKMENGKWKITLDYPQYTRPENFRGWNVPEVLLSGNHAEISRWRKVHAEKRTRERRPDLLKK
ncbi:tRNA (guanosine(37)-N1)-methyltransferase TrmD [Patescibacteria group bacterium]|nr:tRNA (guanosine(37)-N1)-methyltransferase TrmD [Patescibacteria group bacterium]